MKTWSTTYVDNNKKIHWLKIESQVRAPHKFILTLCRYNDKLYAQLRIESSHGIVELTPFTRFNYDFEKITLSRYIVTQGDKLSDVLIADAMISMYQIPISRYKEFLFIFDDEIKNIASPWIENNFKDFMVYLK